MCCASLELAHTINLQILEFEVLYYNFWSAEFDSKIVGLTGPVAAIRQMAQEYRVFFKKVDEEGDDYLIEASHNM